MSELRVGTVSDAAGTGPAALTAQWANQVTLQYDHNTATINKSNNVASVTDNGTGYGTVNFTNAFADINICSQMTGMFNTTNHPALLGYPLNEQPTTGDLDWLSDIHTSATFDSKRVEITVMGDLA